MYHVISAIREGEAVKKFKKKQKKIKGELTETDLAKVTGGFPFFFFKRWAIPAPPPVCCCIDSVR